MAYKMDYNLFVGGKYGYFKGLQCSLDQVLHKNLQNVKYIGPEGSITVMKWGDEEEKEVLLATTDQTVKVYDTECMSFIQSFPAKCGQGPICGVSRFNGVLVTAVESGQIRVWAPKESTEVILDPEDLDIQLSANEETKFDADINAGSKLSCMQQSQYNKNIIGSGGEDNDLSLWDLCTKQKIFHAKNLADDAVRLARPIWVSDIAFLEQMKSVAVCSRYGYVRLYDPKTQRKPVMAMTLPEHALTCMAVSDEHNVICGMAKGDMLMVDLRMRKFVHKYKGFLGAVRSIACHPTAPYIASVSLDRHFRIHHRDTKELLVKEYLALPLHCVLMRSDAVFTENEKAKRKMVKRKKNADEKDWDEYNDMLNSLEKVEERSPKKLNSGAQKKTLLINPFASNKGVFGKHDSDNNEDNREESEDEGNESEEELDSDANVSDDSDCRIVE